MIRQVTIANPFVLSLLASITSIASVLGQEDPNHLFPYQAFVSTPEAEIHSGPDSVHYVTDKLKQGDPVEVYRHDPGGWCAVRPIQGSFSLIPATAIEELGDGVGEITEEGTQAWVGTQLGPVEKPLWQVKLRAGEKVTLLGIATWPDPEGFTSSWYQIEPPAGEFRWIKLENLKIPAAVAKAMTAQTRKPEPVKRDLVADVTPNQSFSNLPSQAQSGVTQAGFETSGEDAGQVELASYMAQERSRKPAPRNNFDEQPASTGGWRKARFPIERANPDQPWSNGAPIASGLGAPVDNRTLPERYASADLNTRYDFSPSNQPWNSGFSSNSFSSGPLTPRMTELELKLNQEMIREPNQWRLVDLQSAAQQVVSSSSDRLEQEQAQRFLAKLENCRFLRDQYIRVGSAGMAPLERADQRNTLNTSAPESKPSSSDLSLNTLYDAHGWLKELTQDGGRLDPAYVLQNEAGKVTHHVLPGPGMNLSSYVSKRIGIIGQRGYHTRLKLDHVTAHKVIELK